jgi:hypothetical protein
VPVHPATVRVAGNVAAALDEGDVAASVSRACGECSDETEFKARSIKLLVTGPQGRNTLELVRSSRHRATSRRRSHGRRNCPQDFDRSGLYMCLLDLTNSSRGMDGHTFSSTHHRLRLRLEVRAAAAFGRRRIEAPPRLLLRAGV